MNVKTKGFVFNSILGQNFIEVTFQIKTNLKQPDFSNIKLFIQEIIENTKGYCNSKNAHQILLIHNYIQRSYRLILPSFLYLGYRFYKHITENKLSIYLNSKQKTQIISFGLLKTSLLFIPILFSFSSFLEYSRKLPLVFLQKHFSQLSDEDITFHNYQKFKERLRNIEKFKLKTNNIKH